MDFETLLYEKQGHTAIVTLNRPDRRNAINLTMAQELGKAWEMVGADRDVRAAILTGAGSESFTYGIDHDNEVVDDRETFGDTTLAASPMARTTARRAGVWKPVICAVNGECCANGGWSLLMDSDVIIASENATFFDNHLAHGFVVAVESVGLARRIPFGEVMRMILSSEFERMTAQRAYQIGLVSEVVAQKDLMRAAHAMADRVSRCAPLATQSSVQNMWKSLEIGSRQAAIDVAALYIQKNRSTEDYQEGRKAARERRPPRWTGR